MQNFYQVYIKFKTKLTDKSSDNKTNDEHEKK